MRSASLPSLLLGIYLGQVPTPDAETPPVASVFRLAFDRAKPLGPCVPDLSGLAHVAPGRGLAPAGCAHRSRRWLSKIRPAGRLTTGIGPIISDIPGHPRFQIRASCTAARLFDQRWSGSAYLHSDVRARLSTARARPGD